MRLVDIHPEELLDKEASGVITDSELVTLDEHCVVCGACAFERRTRAAAMRFESELSPRDAKMDALIAEIAAQPVVRRAASPLFRWANVAAVGLALAFSTAAYAAVKRGLERGWFRADDSHLTDTRGADPSHHRRTKPVAGPEVVSEAPAVPDAGAVAVADAGPTQSPPAPGPKVRHTPPDPPAALSPSERLVAAGKARASGKFADARDLYLGLVAKFPQSPEALVARVAVGNLLLHQLAKPRDAEKHFSAYLRAAPGGALAEEARVGLAQSYAMLGRATDEKKAWEQLLLHHPASVHAARASARIKVLAP